MTAAVIRHTAGVAIPLLTMPGWFTVEVYGDWMPQIVEGEQRVLDLLDTRATAKAAKPPKP